MGTVLGLIATTGRAGLAEFDERFLADEVAAFRGKVRMEFDEEVDTAYPNRWIGKLRVRTTDGRELSSRIDEPRGDPGNTLSRPEIEDKAIRLAGYRQGATEAEMRRVIDLVWSIEGLERVPKLLG